MFWQVVPLLQTIPQPPQLLLSVRVLVQVGPVTLGQTALLAPVHPHVPAVQVCPVAEQSFPHVPQFAFVLLRLTSQPFAGSLSQLAKPGLHTRTHCPMSQVPVIVLARPTQLFPHDPQFIESL